MPTDAPPCCADPDRAHTLSNEGDHAEAVVTCHACDASSREVYPYRRTVAADGAVVKVAGDGTTDFGCCPPAAQHFVQVRIEKTSPTTIVAVGECQNCGARFDDVYEQP